MRLHPNSLIRFLSSTDRTSAVLSLFLLRSSGRRNSTSAISFLLYFFLRIFLHFFLCIPFTLRFHIHLSIRSRAGVHFRFVVTMYPDIAFIEIVFVMLPCDDSCNSSHFYDEYDSVHPCKSCNDTACQSRNASHRDTPYIYGITNCSMWYR